MADVFVINKELIQSPKYSTRLFWSSSTIIISVCSALYNHLYYSSIHSLIVLFTSLLYWIHPIDGIRRKIDIVAVNGSIIYQLKYLTYDIPFYAKYCYVSSCVFCLCFYMMARHYGRREIPDYDMACRWHMCIHVFGNIGNVILYNGLSEYHNTLNKIDQ